jgi:hypothetical protein
VETGCAGGRDAAGRTCGEDVGRFATIAGGGRGRFEAEDRDRSSSVGETVFLTRDSGIGFAACGPVSGEDTLATGGGDWEDAAGTTCAMDVGIVATVAEGCRGRFDAVGRGRSSSVGDASCAS